MSSLKLFKLLTILILVFGGFDTAFGADHQKIEALTLDQQDVDRFTNAIAQIKYFYVKKIDDKKLLEDAIRGMVAGLDPHSEYLDEEAYKSLLIETDGQFGGLGLEVTIEHHAIKVISPIDNSPAKKSGIKAGDYIVAIDRKFVSDMTLQEAVEKMRGPKGTKISLTVIRKDEKKPLKFELIRDIVETASIKTQLFDNHFGYLRISQFQRPTAEKVHDAIQELRKKSNGQLSGLILDLRNNPGGLLDSAVQIADIFLNSNSLKDYNKNIVYTKGRLSFVKFEAKAHSTDLLNGAPLVILINEGSASASEIVAGALQDYKRAIILGKTSFGKGSVQTVLPLTEKQAIKLTTALYHTPSGRLIQGKGIVPDITVEDLKLANKNTDTSLFEPLKEFQLKGALKNTKNNPEKRMTGMTEEESDQLAHEDFQLYEALKILKTVYEVNQQSLSSKN